MSDIQPGYVQPPVPEPPPIPARPRRPWFLPLLTGLLGLAVGAGVASLAWAGGGDSDPVAAESVKPSKSNKPAQSATFTLTGVFTLTDAVDDGFGGCEGTGGYGDIADGTAVTVYDARSEVVATGYLSDPQPGVVGKSCDFTVEVPDVPRGADFYQVEISHRGRVTVSAQEAEDGLFGAELGD